MVLSRLGDFTEEDTALLTYLLREAAHCDALPRHKRARYRGLAEWLEIKLRVRRQRNRLYARKWRRSPESLPIPGTFKEPAAVSV